MKTYRQILEGKKPKLIKSFTNKKDGVTAMVHQKDDGSYIVSLRDDDSGKTLPSKISVKDEKQALKKAKDIASGKGAKGSVAI
jgi:hypothetical protein